MRGPQIMEDVGIVEPQFSHLSWPQYMDFPTSPCSPLVLNCTQLGPLILDLKL